MDFVYAQHHPSPQAGVLGQLNHVEDDFELVEGVPRLDTWPSDATFELDADFGLKLDDVMKCLGSLLVVSDRLRLFLESAILAKVEMLPVTLIDLKGRPIETRYAIVHPVDPPDALDLEASGATFNAIVPDDVRAVQRLALREDAIEPERKIFRLARYTRPLLFERGLAEQIEAEGFTGIGFAPIDTFDRFTML